MQKGTKEIRYFFYSQAFADGFRITLAILLPALIGLYFQHFETGLTISLGAMIVSLTDAPGPIIHKKNGMLFTIAFAFIVAIITPFAQSNFYTLGLEIALVTFFFSMFTVYGNRATAVGNAAILVMILTMDKPTGSYSVLPQALLITAGGLFYMGISVLLYSIRPYRIAQRALGDCIREIANYLSIRADFYNLETDLDTGYKKLLAQQVIVNEKQDAVRELFFKTRQLVQESTDEGRKLVFAFVETLDLFEDITASYYDYASLRNEFGSTGALGIVYKSLMKIVFELDQIGIAIQTNSSFEKSFDYDEEIKGLKSQVDSITANTNANKLVLRKIIVNIRNLLTDMNNIEQYFEKNSSRKKNSLDHSHFVTHQSLGPVIFWNNLTLESSVFRHAIRVGLACSVGFIIARLLSYGHHSYWVLLTIAFILKPAFSLTKKRNIERIIGTLVGGALGVIVLVFIPGKTLHFVFMVTFMIGAYSFMRINYLAMVICITPYVLILFSFLGSGYKDVVKERVFDTILGCAIAFLASYILFPRWESHQLKSFMLGMVKANALYLQKVLDTLCGHKVDMLEYKLARKDVYLNSANLSAAFQRMLSEPKSKQSSQPQLHQFVVLNHILFSNIATVVTTLLSKEVRTHPVELIQLAKKAHSKLKESSRTLGDEIISLPYQIQEMQSPQMDLTTDDLLMKEQLNFIYTVSNDIEEITRAID